MADSLIPRRGWRFKDLSGLRFGKLVALEALESRQGCWFWEFQCDCGKKTVKRGTQVASGKIHSCGCYRSQRLPGEPDFAPVKHGHTRRGAFPPEYQAWTAMNRRCRDPKAAFLKDYGARGIRVCDRWARDYEAFLADVGPRPSPLHSIERIDVNGNYEPGNVRWATPTEQARNKRNNRVLELRGERRTLIEWSERAGMRRETVARRLARGWSVEDALMIAVDKARPWARVSR